MSYTQTERKAIKKKAQELAQILGEDFSDLDNQARDMQTEFFKEYVEKANARVIQKLIDKKITLGEAPYKKERPIPPLSQGTVPAPAQQEEARL